MDNPLAPTMVDVVFALSGRALPREHRAALAAALVARLPWLVDEPAAGVHRVNVAAGGGPVALLSGRATLKLRLPRGRVDALGDLAGAALDVGGEPVVVGRTPRTAELLPHNTLYAHVVAAACDDEAAFLAAVESELSALRIAGRAICGRRQTITDDGALAGFGLMVDRLEPDDALRLLEQGIGPHRLWGCGLFVPHRSAAAVGA